VNSHCVDSCRFPFGPLAVRDFAQAIYQLRKINAVIIGGYSRLLSQLLKFLIVAFGRGFGWPLGDIGALGPDKGNGRRFPEPIHRHAGLY